MTTHVSLETEAPASAPASRSARAASVLAWPALGVVSLTAVLVFWIFEALPFQDLPAHAGLIAMRHRFAESVFEQRY